MTDQAVQSLGQYGAIGIVLAVLLGTFVWLVKVTTKRLLSHFGAVEKIMSETAGAIRDLRDELRSLTRSQIRRTTRRRR